MEVKKTTAAAVPKMQNVILKNREKLEITGVIDVDSFNENHAMVQTTLGLLVVKGTDIKINKLALDSSELLIEGNIFSMEYTDNKVKQKGNFFKKMFK